MKTPICTIYHFSQNMKTHKMVKSQIMKLTFFTLRMPTRVFGLRIGSRGTPWNSKMPGPGGSDFAKCQKVPFIWHFGLFRVFDIFDVFSLFHFFILLIFVDFDFVTFSLFLVFHFFLFLMICIFWCFLSLFCVRDEFWSIFVSVLGASMMTHFSPSIPALSLSPLLVVKKWHNLTPDLVINFWWFLVNFCPN